MKQSFAIFLFLFTLSFAQQPKTLTSLAIMQFQSNESIKESDKEAIWNRFQSELINTGKFDVMDRATIDQIFKEQGLQSSGAISNESQVEMGKMLGVEKLVTGNLAQVGSLYTITVNTIDVQSAKIEKSNSLDVRGGIEEVLTNTCHHLALLVAGLSIKKQAQKQPEKSSAAWLWITGGVVIAGGAVAAVLLSSGEGEDKVLRSSKTNTVDIQEN